MSLRTLVIAFVVAAASLAGCIGSDDPLANTATTTGGDTALEMLPDGLGTASALDPATAEVPTWAIGDAWSIGTNDPDGASETSTLVVIAATGSSYTIASTSEEIAGFDALMDISYVGPISAQDLSGAQRGTPVRFFDFPLKDGKTWTTTWDGLEVALTAKARGDGAFDITGVAGEAVYVTLDYVPALKWFSKLQFAEGYGLSVTKLTTNWTGTYMSATANPLLDLSSTKPAGTFTVSEAQTFVSMLTIGATAHQAAARVIIDPTGAPYTANGGDAEAAPNGAQTFKVERLPPTPGEWRIAHPVAHEPEGFFTVAIAEVAVAQVAFVGAP